MYIYTIQSFYFFIIYLYVYLSSKQTNFRYFTGGPILVQTAFKCLIHNNNMNGLYSNSPNLFLSARFRFKNRLEWHVTHIQPLTASVAEWLTCWNAVQRSRVRLRLFISYIMRLLMINITLILTQIKVHLYFKQQIV